MAAAPSSHWEIHICDFFYLISFPFHCIMMDFHNQNLIFFFFWFCIMLMKCFKFQLINSLNCLNVLFLYWVRRTHLWCSWLFYMNFDNCAFRENAFLAQGGWKKENHIHEVHNLNFYLPRFYLISFCYVILLGICYNIKTTDKMKTF